MGTHLRVLSESYPLNTNMTRFKLFFKYICVFVLWTKVASALEGLSNTTLTDELCSKLSDHVCTPDYNRLRNNAFNLSGLQDFERIHLLAV